MPATEVPDDPISSGVSAPCKDPNSGSYRGPASSRYSHTATITIGTVTAQLRILWIFFQCLDMLHGQVLVETFRTKPG